MIFNMKNTQRHRKNKQENKHVIPESQRDIRDLIYLPFGFFTAPGNNLDPA
jgi:hypothetical protein